MTTKSKKMKTSSKTVGGGGEITVISERGKKKQANEASTTRLYLLLERESHPVSRSSLERFGGSTLVASNCRC